MTESGITSNVPPTEGQEETTQEQNENAGNDVPVSPIEAEPTTSADAATEATSPSDVVAESHGPIADEVSSVADQPEPQPVTTPTENSGETEPVTDENSNAEENPSTSIPLEASTDSSVAVEPAVGDQPSPTDGSGSEDHADDTSEAEQDGEGDGEGGGKGARQRLFPRLSDEEMKQIWDELNIIKNSSQEIEIEVVATNRGGIVASYKGVEVFVPVSHWTLDRHSAAAVSSVRPGDKTTANVLEITAFETDARRVTATRRTVLRRELMQTIEVGTRMSGRIVSILDFGVFVNIGGIDGLLPASEMSHDRVSKPADLFHKGQEVEVVVKDVDRDKRRVYLSRKELLPSPWEGVDERFPAGTIHTGKVVGIGRDGAFVQLEPGVDGFLRAGELSWTRRVASPRDILQKGEEIQVKVLEVSSRRQRVSLSYRQAHDDPWPTLAERYAVGTSWEGAVSSISNKGVVIAIDDVEGFLPRSRMGRESRRLPDMKVGEKLQVNVLEIDPANHSLIFGLTTAEGEAPQQEGQGRGRRGGGRGEGRPDRRGDDRVRMSAVQPVNELKSADTVTNFALGDLITDAIRERLQISDDQPSQMTAPPAAESAPQPSGQPETAGLDVAHASEESGSTSHDGDHGSHVVADADDSTTAGGEVASTDVSTQESPAEGSGAESPQSSETPVSEGEGDGDRTDA